MKCNDSVILSGTKWSRRISFVAGLSSFIFLAACSDVGDRDNPLDPGADNYVAQLEELDEVSSSSISDGKDSDHANGSSSSNAVDPGEDPILSGDSHDRSSSSVNAIDDNGSSSSGGKDTEPAEGSSSSETMASSSSSAEQSPASSSNGESSQSSSSSEEQQSPASSSNGEQPPVSSSGNTEPPPQSSSGNTEPPPPSSSSNDEPKSSSSVAIWTCGDSTVTRGDYEYATVVINEQCWTKENMRYEPSSGTTMCYGGVAANCETYGRLYDYEAANLACPTGWRLPTKTELEDLADYSGADMYDAGAHFKAKSGWTGENGDDLLEFTALPGGKCNEELECSKIGTSGYWWTSTEKVKNSSHYALYLNGDGSSFTAANIMDNDQYISVRCVKK